MSNIKLSESSSSELSQKEVDTTIELTRVLRPRSKNFPIAASNPDERYTIWCNSITNLTSQNQSRCCCFFRKSKTSTKFTNTELLALEHIPQFQTPTSTTAAECRPSMAVLQQVRMDITRSGVVSAPDSLYPLDSKTVFKTETHDQLRVIRRVLLDFGTRFPEIGYCQGSNFIVKEIATALNFNQGRTIVILTALSQRYGFAEIFSESMVGYRVREYQFQRLMHRHFPTVTAHLDNIGIIPMMYVNPWVMTLCMNDESLCANDRAAILDNFLLAGWPYMMSLFLGIIRELQLQILATNDMAQVHFWLRNLGTSLNGKNIASLGLGKHQSKKRKFVVTRKMLSKMEKQFIKTSR